MGKEASAAIRMIAVLTARPDAPATQRFIPAVELSPVKPRSQVEGLRPGTALTSHGARFVKQA